MATIALTIDVNAANATMPAALQERLMGTPTKSPEDLAKDLEVHTLRSAKLRAAHLESVRDRAARESQRAQEAAARKLRLAAARADNIQRKMDAATIKSEAKKEASEAERAAWRAHREELALAVAEARKTANEMRLARGAELLAAENAAASKHAKAVGDVVAKGKSAVAHARAVVKANKEKAAHEAATKGAALADRHAAAEVRRQLAAASDSVRLSTPPRSPLFLVRNEGKISAARRKLAYDASMAKHEAKRTAHLESVVGKAHAENAKAAAVVAKIKAEANGTDAATAEARSAMYERLLKAEVLRLQALKAKYNKYVDAKNTPILVRLDDVLTPRPPPAALVTRLATTSTTLVATAAARQRGAAARRAAGKHDVQLKLAKAAARREAVTAALATVAARKAAALQATAMRVTAARARTRSSWAQAAARAQARIFAAKLKRAQMAKGVQIVGEMKQARVDAAVLKRAQLATDSKADGGVAARASVFKARRAALDAALLEKGRRAAACCAAAADRRVALLEKRRAPTKTATTTAPSES